MLSELFCTSYVPSGAKAVVLQETSVIKKANPLHAMTEVAVTEAASNMAIASGLFYVPLVRRQELTTGTIELERITGLVSFRERFAAGTENLDLLHKVGRALAYTHMHLKLPETLKFRVPLDWECEDKDLVCLHGDFNINNVCYQQEQDRLVVLDWASAGVLSRGKTVGSRYFDLGKFLRSLLCQQRNLLDSIANFNKRASALLEGYQRELGRTLDYRLVRKYLLKMAIRRVQIQFRRKELRKVLGNSVACMILRVLSTRWKQPD